MVVVVVVVKEQHYRSLNHPLFSVLMHARPVLLFGMLFFMAMPVLVHYWWVYVY